MSEFLQSGHHPDADQLNAFVEHVLPPHEHQQMLAHLAICPDCRTVVSLLLPPVEESPIIQPERGRKHWFSGWNLVWPAAAALTALVVLIVHIHNASTLRSNTVTPTQMAASRPPAPLASTTTESPAVPSPSKPHLPSPRPTSGRHLTDVSNPQKPGTVIQQILPSAGSAALASPSAPVPAAPPMASAFRQTQPAATPGPITANGMGIAGAVGQAAEVTSASPVTTLSLDRNGSVRGRAQNVLLRQPLPSHLPVLSMASNGHIILAIDTQNALFFSDDDGEHWKAIPSQWQGHAVKVILASSTIVPGRSSTAPTSSFAVMGGPISSLARVTGTLAGTVTDASGAAIPDASVVVGTATTPIVRTVTTDRSGRYVVDNLVPGSYQVEAKAPGFNKQQVAVTLSASQQSLANLILPGQASESVTVEASAISPDIPILATKKIAEPAPAIHPLPLFEVTTDTGDRWISVNGQTWTHK